MAVPVYGQSWITQAGAWSAAITKSLGAAAPGLGESIELVVRCVETGSDGDCGGRARRARGFEGEAGSIEGRERVGVQETATTRTWTAEMFGEGLAGVRALNGGWESRGRDRVGMAQTVSGQRAICDIPHLGLVSGQSKRAKG